MKPTVKQFGQKENICGVTVNREAPFTEIPIIYGSKKVFSGTSICSTDRSISSHRQQTLWKGILQVIRGNALLGGFEQRIMEKLNKYWKYGLFENSRNFDSVITIITKPIVQFGKPRANLKARNYLESC